MRFTLTIETGNEAMNDFGDIADAVRDVADTLIGYFMAGENRVAVRDRNGNTVGEFTLAHDDGHVCSFDCEDEDCDPDFYDDEHDPFRDDVEADADVLAMAGFGTDEDYGYFGDDEY